MEQSLEQHDQQFHLTIAEKMDKEDSESRNHNDVNNAQALPLPRHSAKDRGAEPPVHHHSLAHGGDATALAE
jgi:hypothetical protein